jgi:hypothetical protein
MVDRVQRFGVIAPRLAGNGYDPVPIIPGQKRPSPKAWTDGGFADRAADYANDYTGIITKGTPAVDIDVSDADLVREIENIVLDVLDCHEMPPPRRIGNAPRTLMVFKTNEPFDKLSTGYYQLATDPIVDGKLKASHVEILASGQQFVAFAIHPETRKPYHWNGAGDLLSVPRDRLVALDWQQAVEIVERCEALLARHGKPVSKPFISQHAGTHKSNEQLHADDPALLMDALRAIPNDDVFYNDWVSMGYAVKAALGDGGVDAFIEWSRKSSKFDEANTRAVWAAAKPMKRGAGSIFWLAERYGWKRPTPTFGGSKVDRDQQWPTPRTIKADLPSAPQFDGDVLLPKVLREFVLDEADRMPCPPDYIAAALIVAMGSVIGARCALKPKKRDDWIVPPNLFGGVVGDPSTKKSPAIGTVMRQIDRLEARQADLLAEKTKVFEAEKAAFAARQAAIQSAMKKAAAGKDDAMKMDEAVAQLRDLAEPEEPTVRRFKTSDATVAKLGDLLSDNPAGLLVYRDELVGLLASWDREGNEGDRSFYLEAWNGTGPFSIDRIARGSLFIPNLCLSVFGGVQPDLLERYLAGIVHALDNDGRVQRFQVLVYPDPVPWEWRDRYPVKGAREAVRDLFTRLADFDPLQDGAHPADDFVKLPFFTFDENAQNVFIEWSTDLHRKKIEPEQNPLMRQHLAKFERLFCSIALILHLAEGRVAHEINVETAMRAAAWCTYLEGHARRIYAMVEVAKVTTAKMLSRRLLDRKLEDGFTARDVVRKGWGGIATTAQAEAALQVLEDHDWISSIDAAGETGRPTTRYYVNPLIWEVAP